MMGACQIHAKIQQHSSHGERCEPAATGAIRVPPISNEQDRILSPACASVDWIGGFPGHGDCTVWLGWAHSRADPHCVGLRRCYYPGAQLLLLRYLPDL